MQEKRRYTRIPCPAPLFVVKENGEEFLGKVANICLKGAYVILDEASALRPDEIVAFSIAFDEIHDIVVTGSGVVVWQDDLRGYGLLFASIEQRCIGELKRLIALNYIDSQKIEQEFEELIT